MKKLIIAAIVMVSALTANAQSVQQDCCKAKAQKECKDCKSCKDCKDCKNCKNCKDCKEMKACEKKCDAQTGATACENKAKAPKKAAKKKVGKRVKAAKK